MVFLCFFPISYGFSHGLPGRVAASPRQQGSGRGGVATTGADHAEGLEGPGMSATAMGISWRYDWI